MQYANLLRLPFERFTVFAPIFALGPLAYALSAHALSSQDFVATALVRLHVPEVAAPTLVLATPGKGLVSGGLERTRILWEAALLLRGEQPFETASLLWEDRQERLEAFRLRCAEGAGAGEKSGEGVAARMKDMLRQGLSFTLVPAAESAATSREVLVRVNARSPHPDDAVAIAWAASEALAKAHRRGVRAQLHAARARLARERPRATAAGAEQEDDPAVLLDDLVERAQEPGVFTAIDAPDEARHPARAGTPLQLAIACGVSFSLALLASFLLAQSDPSVRDPELVSRLLGVPLWGVLPQVASSGGAFPIGRLPAALMESFYAVAANLRPLAAEQDVRSFAIVSPLAREGRSTITCHLGLTLATRGLRVLLVDGHLAAPSLHDFAGAENGQGLRQLLFQLQAADGELNQRVGSIESTLDDYILATSIDNLFLLPAGATTGGSRPVIKKALLHPLILRLSRKVDVVLCDTPALSKGADGLDFAAACDRTILAIDAFAARRPRLLSMKKLILNAQGSLAGLVCNRAAAPYSAQRPAPVAEEQTVLSL